ncbi:MAG: histidine phosphatase family protein [Mesorhizobium sp.]|nr:histidine phosphatase family protein [Mesorhizobium sp.]
MFRIVIVVLAFIAAFPAHATEAGWALLRDGGRVVLIRHAFAPGTGDPANFDIAKCATQRNLSDRGRQQARKIGSLFSAKAAETEKVLSSRSCRSLETARLAFGRLAEPFEALDAFGADDSQKLARNAAVLHEIAEWSGSGNLVLVAEEDVIAALTGISPREGEAMVVRAEGTGVHVLGRIIF